MKQAFGVVLLVSAFHIAIGENYTDSNSLGDIPSGRIVQGEAVTSKVNYRFVVSLVIGGIHVCTATVITYYHTLTAAHCLDAEPPLNTVSIYGGSIDQSKGGAFYPILGYFLHPNYSSSGRNFDAAIVKLRESFAGNRFIKPIELQNAEIKFHHYKINSCYTAGWGSTNGDSRVKPERLQIGWFQLRTLSYCKSQWGDNHITSEMLCGQFPYVDICDGDAGGPLVCNGRLTGVASWSNLACTGAKPAVFTQVIHIRSFIEQHTAA